MIDELRNRELDFTIYILNSRDNDTSVFILS